MPKSLTHSDTTTTGSEPAMEPPRRYTDERRWLTVTQRWKSGLPSPTVPPTHVRAWSLKKQFQQHPQREKEWREWLSYDNSPLILHTEEEEGGHRSTYKETTLSLRRRGRRKALMERALAVGKCGLAFMCAFSLPRAFYFCFILFYAHTTSLSI